MSLMNEAICPKRKKMYCRFKKWGIRYVDYKETNFLLRFLNDQGHILPRKYTGNTAKAQKAINIAVKRAKQIALLPYNVDNLKSLMAKRNENNTDKTGQ